MKKLTRWALLAFAAFYLITNPTGAAGAVHQAANTLTHVGNSLSRFVNHLN